MKFAIFESITTPGGHEVDFDRLLVEELLALGHQVTFYVPEDFQFKIDPNVPVRRLPGEGVSYTGVRGLRKMLLSVKREINRQRWYRAVYQWTLKRDVDAVIVPTSTYRYLRGLYRNPLRKSPVPVIFIVHGVNPKEAPKFFQAAESLRPYPNIRAAVLTFGDSLFGRKDANVVCMTPPAYLPRDLEPGEETAPPEDDPERVLTLGFFGQYRREKKLDVFLEAFLRGSYHRPVRLLVQGATMNPDDAADFERIIRSYCDDPRVEFLHKGLVGPEWQAAIAAVDVLLMPYSAPRYRYHWGGMLFTAIGYKKPVILSDEINPEVLEQYRIGMTYDSRRPGALQETVEEFIHTYDEKAALYRTELDRAHRDYHPRAFAARLAELARSLQGFGS